MKQKKKKDLKNLLKNDLHNHSINAFTPMMIRLAFNSSATYSRYDKSGGSNGGFMRILPECNWNANAGLDKAREFLEPIKEKHPDVSYGDIWTLAGALAVELMGGPKITWRYGRADLDESEHDPNVDESRLPVPSTGCPASDIAHIKSIFGRIGQLNYKEIVSLIGAHSVGRCHEDASGYTGPWTKDETSFSNDYFKVLLQEQWTLKKTHNGKKWTGPPQYENADGTLMMLPVDIALLYDSRFREYVEHFAEDEEDFRATFSKAFSKVLENGVELQTPKPGVMSKYWGFDI